MRSIHPVLLMVLCSASLAAQSPTLTVRDVSGREMPLRLDEVSVEVDLLGDVAETTITLGFWNGTNRLLEGEFAMALPEGATVSRYALEVQGAMREAVAVEKERARFAYESIKRRLVDPGLVEREAGNVYRTRIFPIPRKAIKRVRLGYVEHVPRGEGGLRYELPFEHEGSIAKFSCRFAHLSGGDFEVVETGNLKFEAERPAIRSVVAEKVRLAGKLAARIAPPRAPDLHLERAGEEACYFYLSDTFPEGLPARERPAPDGILLAWDASGSGARRDREKEIALLDAYFKKLGRVSVRLQFLRNVRSEGGRFEVEDGRWEKLREVLENTFYDGATRLGQLDLASAGEDLALVFTDATAPYCDLPPASMPVFVIGAAPAAIPEKVAALAERSGGACLDLLKAGIEVHLERLTTIPPGVVSVKGSLQGEALVDADGGPGQPVRVFGRLALDQLPGELVISYRGLERTVPIRASRPPDGSGIVRRLWAQRALVELEQAPRRNEAALISHCKDHGLVSDLTSLIVLERFEDHLRYEIPPPEPNLRERYDAALRKKSNSASWRELIRAWKQRRAWHEKEHPWMEVLLVPRYRQVSIWVSAIKRVFDEVELDRKAFAVINDWRRSVLSVMERKTTLRTASEFEAWFAEVGLLAAKGKTLKETPVRAPTDAPVVVSVRGLVNEPGKVSGKGLTLRQAIEKAGGVHLLGTASAVEHYRNASKVTYNLLSKQFEDLALLPGDMIVVRDSSWADSRSEDGFGDVDPFSAEPSTPPDPSDGPAVVEEGDLWVGNSPEGGGGASDPFAVEGGPPGGVLAAEIRTVAARVGAVPELQELGRALEEGRDPLSVYRALKKEAGDSVEFFIEAARMLFAHGHPALGAQVLSNLIETPTLRVDRLLAVAMWLHEFDQPKRAVELLEHGIGLAPEVPILRYYLARLAMGRNDQPGARSQLVKAVQAWRTEDASAAEIALTDLTGLDASRGADQPAPESHVSEGFPEELQGNLAADLRVVISTNQPNHHLRVTVSEPAGHTCRWTSPCGGRLVRADGLTDYMMRRALPGRYTISCRSEVALTLHLVLYRNWGRPNQEAREYTVLLDGTGQEVDIAEYEFAFVGEEEGGG